ncbi:MAG: response regulator transcription factor, partial [Candidatus Aminicenantes bacterium]|nr:response regulator transcription factor [Candidatus Aminicenantes bacterium]
MSKKVLIVEDDPGISLSLKDEFESLGYTVIKTDNGQKGLTIARQESPDLIILDLMLPVMDGYDVCRELRNEGNRTPIIMLTAKNKEIDKVLGLELGADDYVTKPFSLRELMARVRAVLRRTTERKEDIDTYCFGQIELDFKKHEATKRGKKMDLTPLQFQMLKLLIQKKREVISRDEFLDEIWGRDNV